MTDHITDLARAPHIHEYHPPGYKWNLKNYYTHSLCGGLSYLLVETLLHPVDTIRARIMAEDSAYITTRMMAKRMFRQEGMRSYFRGITSAGYGAFLGNLIYFQFYEAVKDYLEYKWKWSVGKSGAIGALVAQFGYNIVYLPFDLVRTRFQVPTGGYKYRTNIEAFKSIIRSEGFPGLYKGWRIWLMSDLTGTACTFGIYEEFKRFLLHGKKNPKDIEVFLGSSLSYFLASTMVSVVTVPFLLVITRIQLSHEEGSTRNAMKIIKDVYRNEGMLGFFKGWTAKVFVISTCSIVGMPLYETLKHKIGLFKFNADSKN